MGTEIWTVELSSILPVRNDSARYVDIFITSFSIFCVHNIVLGTKIDRLVEFEVRGLYHIGSF